MNNKNNGRALLFSRPTTILIFLALSYAISFYDRMLMVVVGETVKQDFVLSDKQLSLLTGAAFVIIYGVVGLGAGWLADRTNRKRILVVTLAIWSAATMACGLAQSFSQLVLARAAVGVGEAATVPTGMSIIGDAFPREKRPMATAIFLGGAMAGLLGSFLLGSWVADRFGWRAAFLTAGAPGILLALFMAFVMRLPPRKAEADEAGGRAETFRLVGRNAPLMWLIFAHALSNFAGNGMIQWLPMFFMRSHDLDVRQIGLFFGPVLGGGMLGGMLLGGHLGNAVAKRSTAALVKFSIGSLLALIPLYLVLLWAPSLWVALAATFLAAGIGVLYIPSSMAAWQSVCPPQARGTAAGIVGFTSMLLGAALFPFLVGALSDRWKVELGDESLRYALMAGSAFAVATAALYWRANALLKKFGLERGAF